MLVRAGICAGSIGNGARAGRETLVARRDRGAAERVRVPPAETLGAEGGDRAAGTRVWTALVRAVSGRVSASACGCGWKRRSGGGRGARGAARDALRRERAGADGARRAAVPGGALFSGSDRSARGGRPHFLQCKTGARRGKGRHVLFRKGRLACRNGEGRMDSDEGREFACKLAGEAQRKARRDGSVHLPGGCGGISARLAARCAGWHALRAAKRAVHRGGWLRRLDCRLWRFSW